MSGGGEVRGAPASERAVEVARDRGSLLAGHRTWPLTRALVDEHDLVLVLEPWQRDVVEALGGGGKTRLLDDASPVEDRFLVGSRLAYERTYDQLEVAIARALERLPEEASA